MSNKQVIVTDHSLRAFPMDIEDNVKIVGGLKPNTIGTDVIYAVLLTNTSAGTANTVTIYSFKEGDTFGTVSPAQSTGVPVLASFSLPYATDSVAACTINEANELFIYLRTRVLKYSLEGDLLGNWEVSGFTKGIYTKEIIIDKQGFLYVLTTQNRLDLHKINPNTGEILWSHQIITTTAVGCLMCLSPNNEIFVSRSNSNVPRIYRIDMSTGLRIGGWYDHDQSTFNDNLIWHENRLWMLSQNHISRVNNDFTFHDRRTVSELNTGTAGKGLQIANGKLYLGEYTNVLRIHDFDTLAAISTYNLSSGGTASSRFQIPKVDIRGNIYCASGGGTDQRRINTFDKNDEMVTRHHFGTIFEPVITIGFKYEITNGYYT